MHYVTILLAAEVTCVEDLYAVHLDYEHRRPYYVASNIGCDFDSFFLNFDSKFDLADAGEGLGDVLLGEEDFLLVAHFQSVLDQVSIDVLGRLCHVHFLFVVVLRQEVWQGSTVVQVGVGYKHHGKILHIVEFVKKWKCFFSALVNHKSAIKHDVFVIDCEDDAGSSYFTSCTQGKN